MADIGVDFIEFAGAEGYAPSNVTVSVDRGLDGQRGTYIIAVLGNPNNLTFPVYFGFNNDLVYAQYLDWAINLDYTDPEYMTVYQLKYPGTDQEWEKIYKQMPNTYNTNESVDFTPGIGMATQVISASEDVLDLLQQFGNPEIDIPADEDSFLVFSLEEMLALDVHDIQTNQYAYRQDISQFFKLTLLPASNIDNWKPEISINLHADIENEFPIASTAKCQKPTKTIVDGKRVYTFPIFIMASEGNTEFGWGPLLGTKTVHISLNVI